MRYVPNILSISRIVLAVSLLWFKPLSAPFYAVFALCGITDMVDGAIARRWNASSAFGSKLDSIADVTLTVIALVILIPIVNPPEFIVTWILIIVAARVVALVIALKRYKKATFLHTTSNRVGAMLLFLYPFGLIFTDSLMLPVLLCTVTSLAAIEEIAIMATAPELDPDIKSFRVMLKG